MRLKNNSGLVVNIFSMLMGFSGLAHVAYASQQSSSLDAHVHGLSELTIAMDNDVLEIQFASPAMNLLGFEYKASSQKEVATVKKVESLLLQHDQLFSLSNADCKHVSTSVDLSDQIDNDDHEYHDDHQEHDDHKEHHGHKGHQADNDHHNDYDDHSDHKEHDHNESHSEIVVTYSYQCKDASELSSLKVSLFEAFAGIDELQVLWVMPTKQGSIMLKPSSSVIDFK
ncbi:MAG: ZrgA family zinc uptake protein [Porticoccaceae bacterium]